MRIKCFFFPPEFLILCDIFKSLMNDFPLSVSSNLKILDWFCSSGPEENVGLEEGGEINQIVIGTRSLHSFVPQVCM